MAMIWLSFVILSFLDGRGLTGSVTAASVVSFPAPDEMTSSILMRRNGASVPFLRGELFARWSLDLQTP